MLTELRDAQGALENYQAGLAAADKSLQRVSTRWITCWIVPMYWRQWGSILTQAARAKMPQGRRAGLAEARDPQRAGWVGRI